MRITDKIEFWLEEIRPIKKDWEKMGIKTGKKSKVEKKPAKPGTRLPKLEEKKQHNKYTCDKCGKRKLPADFPANDPMMYKTCIACGGKGPKGVKGKKKVSKKSEKEDYAQEKKRAWAEDVDSLTGKVQNKPRTLECSTCGKAKEYNEMKHFKTPKGTYSICNECLAEKGKNSLKEGIRVTYGGEEGSPKDLTKFLKSMKGKKDKDIIKGLMKKFDLSKDDAERALELM